MHCVSGWLGGTHTHTKDILHTLEGWAGRGDTLTQDTLHALGGWRHNCGTLCPSLLWRVNQRQPLKKKKLYAPVLHVRFACSVCPQCVCQCVCVCVCAPHRLSVCSVSVCASYRLSACSVCSVSLVSACVCVCVRVCVRRGGGGHGTDKTRTSLAYSETTLRSKEHPAIILHTKRLIKSQFAANFRFIDSLDMIPFKRV